MVIHYMSALSLRLQNDLKEAMRSSNTTLRDVVRFLRSEIHNVEIERGRPLTDDEIVAVVQRQIKQRYDSIEQFARGGRQDLVDNERAQVVILEQYLPPQLSDDMVLEEARNAVRELQASGPGDMGRVMSVLRERIGTRAQGNIIAQAARTALTELHGESTRG